MGKANENLQISDVITGARDCDCAEIKRINAELLGLLKMAHCPNRDCIGGAIPHGPNPDGDWEAEQCQWCVMREIKQ